MVPKRGVTEVHIELDPPSPTEVEHTRQLGDVALV
jgi:hypothetical protein